MELFENWVVEYNFKELLLLGYLTFLGAPGLVRISFGCFSGTDGEIQSQKFLTFKATQALRKMNGM